jgi:predicted transcriptional regulator
MSVTITEADVLEALAHAVAGTGPRDAKTTREIAAESGMTENKVRNALRSFQAEGRLQVHQVLRTSLDGKMKPCAGYTITPRKKAARK